MIRRTLLLSLLLSSWITQAYPCSQILFEYVYNNPVSIVNHDLTIRWFYNTGCEGHDQHSNKFVVQVQNIFDEVLLTDTVEGFSYTIKPESLASDPGLSVFHVQELGEDSKYSVGLQTSDPDLKIPETPIDKLNTFLLNGYFLNVLPILEDLNRLDLLTDIAEQLSLLCPPNYPDDCNFFNSYLSGISGSLINMPFVTGLDEFTTHLNNGTKKDYIKGDPFTIELLISPNNEVVSLEIEPVYHKILIEDLVKNLSFENPHHENAIVLINVNKSENGKEYVIANKRALIDPNSNDFQKKYPYRGAIH